MLIGGGGVGAYSYIQVLPNLFFQKILHTDSFTTLNDKQQETTQNLKVSFKVIKAQKCGCPSGH